MPRFLNRSFAIRLGLIASMLATAVAWVNPRAAIGCPFCSAQAQTLSEEMEAMDAVILARMVEPPSKPEEKEGEKAEFSIPRATFQVVEVLKGGGRIKKDQKIVAVFYSEPKDGAKYLMMGVDPTASPTDTAPKTASEEPLTWSTPISIVPEVEDYLHQLPKLPKEGLERISFFNKFLECPTDLLARDAFDEFARTPYQTVQKLKPEMNKAQLWTWIRNPELPTFRRRLYLTMLGVCGDDSDVPELEKMLTATNRADRTALDALVASYLTLKGESGVELVEQLFLKNPKAEYSDLYSTIMSLRVLADEIKSIPRPRIIAAFRSVLERPDLADLVIPDLARYEDWDSIDRLVDLYRTADPKTSFVRVPVVNFVRACPLPKAEAALEELKKIDPESVRRANSLFPFSPKSGDRAKPPQSSYFDGSEPGKLSTEAAPTPIVGSAPTGTSTENIDPNVVLAAASETTPVGDEAAGPSTTTSSRRRAFAVNSGVAPPKALAKNSQPAPNLWAILGVSAGLGLCFFLAQSWLLNGGRSS